MRKFSMLALAGAATLAIALPASAQPGYQYGGGYDRGYDNRGGYDRGSSRGLLAEINQLYSMVDRDLQTGRMNKSQAKKYFRRLDGDRDRLMRERGYVRPDTEREVARDVADIQRAYREFQRNQRYDRYDRRW